MTVAEASTDCMVPVALPAGAKPAEGGWLP